MGERVDLDAAQARYQAAADLGGAHELAPHNYRDLKRSWQDVPALVAELRVAREVIDAAHAVFRRGLNLSHLMQAVERYDRQAQPSTTKPETDA